MLILRELSFLSIVIRISLAFALGGIVGIERGIKNRPAGLRTYMLVCLGSCIVMILSQYVHLLYGSGDPSRMGAQVISGIGFLGAGTIIVTKQNQIRGLTTAAGLWSSACMGLAIGIGFYELAAVGGMAILMVLTIMQSIDNLMRKKIRSIEIYAELQDNTTVGDFLHYMKQNEISTGNLQIVKQPNSKTGKNNIAIIVTLKGRRSKNHQDILTIAEHMHGLHNVEELL